MKQSLRVLLEGLIDYAGLFPPAGLSMEEAVFKYARYREGEHAFALGRFVVPADRVGEVPADFAVTMVERRTLRPPVVARRSAAEAAAAPQETLELVAATAADVERIASEGDGRTTYVEISDLSLLDRIAKHGLRAKIRTGGVTADAFPAVDRVAAFIRACKEKGVAFKATAGLHHPLRCVRPLTYEPDAPTGTMHGFLNVFLAAALLDRAEAILGETDASAFAFEDDSAGWRDQCVPTDELRTMRETFATSFGSCSFEEPIEDLRALGWL